MATKEKWVDLFEKVIGRKPTASEFQAGKQSNFDPKKIKEIAGEAEEVTTDTSSVENTTDEASDNQDIVQETPSEDSVTEESVQPSSQDEKQGAFESTQYEELRKNWLQLLKIILVENLPKKNLQKLRVKDSLTCLFGLNCSTRNYHRNR